MLDLMVFPNTRQGLMDLINGATHLGQEVTATWHLEANTATGNPAGPFPLIYIGAPRGVIGYIDRVDRIKLDCYAPGTLAVEILESVTASLCGTNIETPSGFLDSIQVVLAPEDIDYVSDTMNLASATFEVISRPVN